MQGNKVPTRRQSYLVMFHPSMILRSSYTHPISPFPSAFEGLSIDFASLVRVFLLLVQGGTA
jgi:hypothetical protein